jgi:GcrA cell cycle regulator
METLNWTDERKGQLEHLYRDGLSFSLIAAEIGVSRNAAIGKAHRMRLPKRIEIAKSKRNPRRVKPPAKRRQRRTTTIRAFAVVPEPVIIPGQDYRCGILALNDATCRYPCWGLGTPVNERLYCGCPGARLTDNEPYCERHAKLCFPPR